MEKYYQLESSISGIEDIVRICKETVEDAANDGVVHVEPILPNPWDYPAWNLGYDEFFDRIDDAFRKSSQQYGVSVSYIVGVDRAMPTSVLEKVAQWAVDYQERGVEAFAYGGNEALGSQKVASACAIARKGGLQVIPHAGESCGPPSIVEALAITEASRLSHGIRAVESEILMDVLAQNQICCDICPTSNVRMGVFGSFKEIPIKSFIQAGIPFTLNSDDSLFFGASIVDEYSNIQKEFNLDEAQIAKIASDSIRFSYASNIVKTKAIDDIAKWKEKALEGKGYLL
jgi:adenosine deaminase